jgi:hypothetical protein
LKVVLNSINQMGFFFFYIPALDQVPSSHDSSQARDSHEFSKARIDIRKFAQFLSGQLVSPTKVICSMYLIFKI